uniref:Uncharacterized protein n=1 Tax=Anguilla anguilla TaxID=7936 RepID=A0A0E9SR50_ANGAN
MVEGGGAKSLLHAILRAELTQKRTGSAHLISFFIGRFLLFDWIVGICV